jgi:hypothetical protein
MQPNFLTRDSPAAAHRLPMPQGARVVGRPRGHCASSLPRLDRIPRDCSPQCADDPDVLLAPEPSKGLF